MGSHLKLITTGKRENKFEKTDVAFPWKERFKEGTDVTTIECPGKQSVSLNGETGTTLIISDILEEWNQRAYDYIKRKLAVLVANRGIKREGFKYDPGFNIIIEAPQFEEKTKDLRDELLKSGWGILTAFVNNKGDAFLKLDALNIGKKKFKPEVNFLPLKNTILKIGIMVEDKTQLRNNKVLSLGTLNQLLQYWGGVQIRYRGFRVGNYGDDDWLDIDRDRGLRKTTPKSELFVFAQTLKGVDPSRAYLNFLSMRNHIGNVDIGNNADGFEMKANREGFIDSEAFAQLKLFVRHAINWATIWREYYIRQNARENSEIARQYLEDMLDQKVEKENIVEYAVKYIDKEIKNVISYLPSNEKREVQKTLNKATDAILKHEKNNQEELRHLRLVASTSTLLLIFSHEVKSLLGLLENNSNSLDILENNLSQTDKKLIQRIRSELSESKNRFEDLLDMTSLISINSNRTKLSDLALKERVAKAKNAFNLIIHDYEIDVNFDDIPTNLIIHNIFEAELYTILLNVLSNSIKSVIAGKNKRKIKIAANKLNGKNRINIMDTGMGLNPDRYEDVFIPFLADPDKNLYSELDNKLNPSDKYIVGTGSGLGLSIVKEIIQVRQGNIYFITPSGEWKANLEIELL